MGTKGRDSRREWSLVAVSPFSGSWGWDHRAWEDNKKRLEYGVGHQGYFAFLFFLQQTKDGGVKAQWPAFSGGMVSFFFFAYTRLPSSWEERPGGDVLRSLKCLAEG